MPTDIADKQIFIDPVFEAHPFVAVIILLREHGLARRIPSVLGEQVPGVKNHQPLGLGQERQENDSQR